MLKKWSVPRAVHIKSVRSSGLWNAMDAGIGSWQRVAAVGYCVCCHLAVPVDYFKIKYFGTIASLGNLAERSSHFIAPLSS